MIFVDTNYFLRFLLNDNESQNELVKQLFFSGAEGKIELFTSTVVIFEIYWVLSSYYEKKKQEVAGVLEKILQLTFIDLSERDILLKSVSLFGQTNFDLEDCYNLIYAKTNGAKAIKTFDKKLEKEFSHHPSFS